MKLSYKCNHTYVHVHSNGYMYSNAIKNKNVFKLKLVPLVTKVTFHGTKFYGILVLQILLTFVLLYYYELFIINFSSNAKHFAFRMVFKLSYQTVIFQPYGAQKIWKFFSVDVRSICII